MLHIGVPIGLTTHSYPPACCDFFILIIREFKNRESYSALLVTETAHNILTTIFLPQFHLTVTFNYMITSI